MKISRGVKIVLAGTVTWSAAVWSYIAIFDLWDTISYPEEFVTQLCLLPPAVLLIGFLLFRWALGEAFATWLFDNKPKVSTVLFFALLLAASYNASIAASNSEDAYYMADQANDAAVTAAYAAESASDAAQDAASDASAANISCSYR